MNDDMLNKVYVSSFINVQCLMDMSECDMRGQMKSQPCSNAIQENHRKYELNIFDYSWLTVARPQLM